MGPHYITFMGRSLENKKKLMPVWIVNDAGISSLLIATLLWIVFSSNNAKMNNDSYE